MPSLSISCAFLNGKCLAFHFSIAGYLVEFISWILRFNLAGWYPACHTQHNFWKVFWARLHPSLCCVPRINLHLAVNSVLNVVRPLLVSSRSFTLSGDHVTWDSLLGNIWILFVVLPTSGSLSSCYFCSICCIEILAQHVADIYTAYNPYCDLKICSWYMLMLLFHTYHFVAYVCLPHLSLKLLKKVILRWCI